MDLGIPARRLRCATVWGVVTVVAAVVVLGVTPLLSQGAAAVASGALATTSFDVVLVWLCAAVAAVVTGWLWVVATLVTLDAARGLSRSRRGVPAGIRRGVLLLCGAVLTTGLAGPALAAGGRADPHAPAAVLAGLRLPERVGVSVIDRHVPRSPSPRPVARVPRTLVVAPGDTLWELAARELGPGASSAEVAAAWPRLYDANRDLIGPDPGLIEPGQRLVVPQDGDGHDAR